jgi:Lipocalin-like domain
MSGSIKLLGTWRLVSFEARDLSGKQQYPLGKDVSGQLIYDAAGNMSAHVMRNDRPLFAIDDPARAMDSEVRSAFDGHASYFGTYEIDEAMQTVTHHVQGAWYPNWIGKDQLRYFKFDGDRLVLISPPIVSDGESLEYVLTWERVA